MSVSYSFTQAVSDPNGLRMFLRDYATDLYSSMTYTLPDQIVIYTNETSYSDDTSTKLGNILTMYPNLPPPPNGNPNIDAPDDNDIGAKTLTTYLPDSCAIDGDIIITANSTLTRNMYYRNLTVNAGANLNASGWRVLVTQNLVLDGVISNDGGSATTSTGGICPTTFTTYLGCGTNGANGVTSTGAGAPGIASTYQNGGSKGGKGGGIVGGLGGTIIPMIDLHGGRNVLSTMPNAIVGRTLSSNYYIQGGTGGGSGAVTKGSASTVASGGGGAGAGVVVVAANKVSGTGSITAKGGAGGNAAATGTNLTSTAVGGGGGGGGGCVIFIFGSSNSVTVDVSGGAGGNGAGTLADSTYVGNVGTSGYYYPIQM